MMVCADLQALPGGGGEVQVRLVLGVSERRTLHLPARAAARLRAEAGQEEDGGEEDGAVAGGPHRARAGRAGGQPHADHARHLPRLEEEED